MDRSLSNEHEALLRTALRLDESRSIPDRAIDLYWEFSRTLRRLGLPLTERELAIITVLAGLAPPEPATSFLDEAPVLQVNDRVLAKFRGKFRWGYYQGVDSRSKKILVQLDDETAEVRNFSPTSVRLPEKEELASIGE